jgi:two-component system NtrC family response regulator
MGLYEALADFEKNLIEKALIESGGVQVIAAKLLKIGKSGLNQKIKKLGIDITRFAV